MVATVADMSARELDGARIAVVGASGALGSLVSRELVRRGARLLLVGRDATRLEALGIDAPVVVADVGDATAGDAVAGGRARRRTAGWTGWSTRPASSPSAPSSTPPTR